VIEIRISDLKNRLTRIIRRAQGGEVVHITHHGKPVAVLLSVAEDERPQRQQPRRGFWEAIQAMRADPAFEPVDFTQEEIDGWRDRPGERQVLRRD
jgi:prevent-host-death family protein